MAQLVKWLIWKYGDPSLIPSTHMKESRVGWCQPSLLTRGVVLWPAHEYSCELGDIVKTLTPPHSVTPLAGSYSKYFLPLYVVDICDICHRPKINVNDSSPNLVNRIGK